MTGPGTIRLRALARWAPLAGVLAWLAWETAAGHLRPDLPHVLAAGMAGAAWLAGRRLWGAAALAALLLTPLAWHFAVSLPAAQRALHEPRGTVRIEGTVRARSALEHEGAQGAQSEGGARLLLGDAVLWRHGERLRLAELEAELPGVSEWAIAHRSRLRIGGTLRPGPAGVALRRGRLRLAFAAGEHHRVSEPPAAWSGEALRLHLRDRAAYYLSRPALAVYLPVVLGVRERDTPEAREVAGAFRRVGVAHLFAISGLHVGLLYGLFLLLQHWGLGWLRRGQGWVHAPALRRAGVLAAVWLYIALIGFPIPAVRAALMGSLLVWNEHWGTRSPPLYMLGMAALLLLAGDPSQLYDVSFQLSFGAYFFLLCALGLHRPVLGAREGRQRPRWRRWLQGGIEGAWLNLWLTVLITAGLWPLVSASFGTISLLVFVGNLVMVPLLGLVVLPAGLAGLATSGLYAGAAPGAWLERAVFSVLDAVLLGWVWLVERLDALSGLLVLAVRLDWPPQVYAGYYAVLLAAIGWGFARRNRRRGASGAAP
ncbi:MAG TPA: ComEC/Rec2 family competence protein [bacterium]